MWIASVVENGSVRGSLANVCTRMLRRERGHEGERVAVVESVRNHYRVMLSMSRSSFWMHTVQKGRDRKASMVGMNNEDPRAVGAKVSR